MRLLAAADYGAAMKTSSRNVVIRRFCAIAVIVAASLCIGGCHHENGDDNRNANAVDRRLTPTNVTAMGAMLVVTDAA